MLNVSKCKVRLIKVRRVQRGRGLQMGEEDPTRIKPGQVLIARCKRIEFVIARRLTQENFASRSSDVATVFSKLGSTFRNPAIMLHPFPLGGDRPVPRTAD